MIFISFCFKHKEGGYNKKLYQVYHALSRQGHTIHLICAERLPVSGDQIFQSVVSAPHSDRETRLFWIVFCIKTVVKAYAISRKYRIKAIVNFGALYGFLGFLPVMFKNIPSIVFIRGDNMKHSADRLRNHVFFVLDGLGIWLAKKVVFNSKAVSDVYRKRYGIKREKCAYIPNHIEHTFRYGCEERSRLRKAFGVAENEFLLTTSGILNPGKNFEFLIRALAFLPARAVKLMIIGDEIVTNGQKSFLKRLSRLNRVDDTVIFCGWQNDPRPYIASSDAFVFPSRHEGMPNSLLEALSCQVPCFGSNISEIREVLKYRDLLFSIQDHQEYVKLIKRLISDKKFYLKTRELSRRRCREFIFDWDQETTRFVLESL